MQTRHPQADIEDFQAGIFSKDPVEYNAAINLYVEPHASYSSSLISTHGATKIKHIVAFKKLFVREIKVDKRKSAASKGGPQWDEDSQVYTVPTLTTYGLPFALPIIDLSFTFPTSLTFHLNVNEDSDLESDDEDDRASTTRAGAESSPTEGKGKRYVVTKWEERGPLDVVIGFGGGTVEKLHRSFLRPMTTLFLLLLAGSQHFIHTHPLSDGILNVVFAAIVTFVTEARDIILAELSSKHPRMVYHTDDHAKKVKESGHSAQSSVSSAIHNKIPITRPQSPASSVRSRTSARAPFPPPSAGSPTISASPVFATGAVIKKPHDLTAEEHASFAEVVEEGEVSQEVSHKRTGSSGKKLGRSQKQPAVAAGIDGDHASYAQVVADGEEEHEHHHHPAELDGDKGPKDGPDAGSSHQEHHASYAEVAAEGVVEHDN